MDPSRMTNGCSSGLYVLLIPLGGFVVLPGILDTEQILSLQEQVAHGHMGALESP